ncbi:Uncharacterised protein [Mycobacteroides abscessus subsp. abscessus]|nr:Uncharacterised protein [Mycobacteroides abscessus subsp. abscessus]
MGGRSTSEPSTRCVVSDPACTAARFAWKTRVSSSLRTMLPNTATSPRGRATESASPIAWVSSGCGLISMNVEYDSAARVTACEKRTGLRRLRAQ